MIQTEGTTTNFVVKYEDTNFATNPPSAFKNVQRRAQQLLATCESDFYVLRSWFGLNDGFGASNRVTLQVEPASYARNFGYKSDGTSFIRMNPFDDFAVQEQADDAVQSLFVAEMIEILMDYRNIKNKSVSWHADKSDGEGLSRVAAAILHPVGYYKVLSGPFVNNWLKLKRSEDWVSKNEDTDEGMYSYGCAILFIYYMRDQLQHSMTDIIKKGGDTLEATYKNVTGSTGGFATFKALLDKYLPYDPADAKKQMADLVSDNPFPIWEGYARRVGLRFTEESVAKAVKGVRRGATVKVRPFFICPEATYRYSRRNLDSTLRCIASAEGFAQPVFSWKVNGLQTATGGSILPTVPITVDQPAHPGEPTNTSGAAHMQWNEKSNTATFEEITGELDLSNSSDNHLGHEQLSIEVTVKEKFGSADAITIARDATLDTRDVRYEGKFYTDRAKCLAQFERQINRYGLREIPRIFKVPEPDPPPEWLQALRTLRGVADELVTVRQQDPRMAMRLTEQLVRSLQIPAEVFAALAEVSGQSASAKDGGAARGARSKKIK